MWVYGNHKDITIIGGILADRLSSHLGPGEIREKAQGGLSDTVMSNHSLEGSDYYGWRDTVNLRQK